MSSFPPSDDSKREQSEEFTRYAGGSDDGDDFDSSDDFELFDEAEPTTGVVGVLGEYLLIEPIGAGGMGQVFRAEHRTMNREVALKILSKQIADRKDLLEQFFAEIRAVARLMHPNIVTAFDAGSADDTHYLVMELVDGVMLSSHVRENGPLSVSESVQVVEQAARALAYAHQVGIVHRDIKPGNMMLSKDGVLKILDFGLAHFSKAGEEAQNQNMFMGTPEYMSPEQIENPDAVDQRSDLYSLGATLYFLLTGKAMFTGDKMQVARAQLHQKPTPLFVARHDVDLRIDAVFQRLVAKQPADRYANADELLENLGSLNLTSASTTTSNVLQRGAYRLTSDAPTSVAVDKSTLAKKSRVLAIDLGMLSSTAAYYDEELGPQVVVQGEGNSRHMRNMLWSSGEQMRIGEEAVAQRKIEPEKIFHSVQRWIGAREISKPFAGKKVPPEVLLAAILRQIQQNSAGVTDNSSSAIVTVPACYDQMHRRAIRTATQIAGLELVQLLDKPLAAALNWLDVSCRLSSASAGIATNEQKLLVVHLGGTGMEAGVVHIQGTNAQLLGNCGHWNLGLQRWQHFLSEYFAGALQERTGHSIRNDVAAATRLQRTVEMATDRLTRTGKVDVRFDWMNESVQQTVTQDGLLKIAPNLVSAIQQSIQIALAIAKTDPSEIDEILLAGSMMHMKSVRRLVTKTIPHSIKATVLDKDEFARGAAVQAQSVSQLSNDALRPSGRASTSYDFALVTSGSTKKPRNLLERGTRLPASITRTLRPKSSGGKSILPAFQLIESTSLGENNWNKLGKSDPAQAFPEWRDDPLQLRMEVDENGILESSLIWSASNQQMRIPPTCETELTEEEIRVWRDWLETTMLCSD